MRFNGFEDEWKVIKINYIVNIKAGGDLEKNKLLKDGKYPVIGNTLKNNGIIGYTNTFKIEAPAVTVTGRGEIGKAFYQPIPFTPVVRLLALVPKNKNIDMKFLSNEIENLNFFSESTGVPQLTAPELGTYKVGLTECSEQQKIGNFFAKLDKLLDLQQQKIDKLELLKKALLQKLFPKHDAKIPELRFKGYKENWNEKKLNSITKRLDNYRKPITANKRLSGQTPYYGANGIQDYVKGYTHEGEFVLIAEDGANDIRNYPVRFVKGYIWVNNHAHVLQAKVGISNNLFLSYSLKNKNLLPYLVGSGRMKLNADVLMNLLLKIPDLNEQQKIGSILSKIDQLIESENRKLQNFQQVKKCLLQNMFVE